MNDTDGLTVILRRLDEGHEGAFDDLVDYVYDQIRGIAHNRRNQRFGVQAHQLTEQTTQLANEVIVEIQRQRNVPGNTEQFFAIATRILMRRLTDYQRARLADRRGGGNRGGPILDEPSSGIPSATESERVREVIEELHALDPRKAEVVTLYLWRGLPLPKVAEWLEVSLPTVEREWRAAKAWLGAQLQG